MGFDRVIENSLDANQLSSIDTGAEPVGVASSIALTVGVFSSDIGAQYRMTTPWLTLREGEFTGISSIMAQKRNPVGINDVRIAASDTLGLATIYLFKAHNAPHGVPDYKGNDPMHALARAADTLARLSAAVGQLKFNEQRALEEINADYATTTELADILQRDADVRFRVGHHFASDLVTYGRGKGLRPSQIPFAVAQEIYAKASDHFGRSEKRLSLDEASFRRAFTPENMVRSSRGLGGPQPAEVRRMLEAQRKQLAADRAWIVERETKLAAASARLEQAFVSLRERQ